MTDRFRFSFPLAYTHWRVMIARSRLDGAAIAAPDAPHLPITLAALDAGWHVICEQPLAMNVTVAHEMLERAMARPHQHLRYSTIV